MLTLLCALVILSISNRAQQPPAKGTLSGRVIAEDGRPAAYAEVAILEPKIRGGRLVLREQDSVEADREGRYLIEHDPKPFYITVSSGLLGVTRVASGAPMFMSDPELIGDASVDGSLQPFQLTAGVEQSRDLRVRHVRIATVSGVLRDHGRPVEAASVWVSREGAFEPREDFPTKTDKAGQFSLILLWPGQYTVFAGQHDPFEMIARTTITVLGDDIDNFRLSTVTRPRIKGRIVYDGSKSHPKALEFVMYGPLEPRDHGSVIVFRETKPVAGDRFDFSVDPTFSLLGFHTSDNWTVRSIVADGRNILDRPVDWQPGTVTNVVVTLTDRVSHVVGRVLRHQWDDVVVVFPVNRTLWVDSGPYPRSSDRCRLLDHDSCDLAGLVAGEYFAAAVHDADYFRGFSAGQLEDLSKRATRFSLAEGETKTLDLEGVEAPTPRDRLSLARGR